MIDLGSQATLPTELHRHRFTEGEVGTDPEDKAESV